MRGFNSGDLMISGIENVADLTVDRVPVGKAFGPYPYHSLICQYRGNRVFSVSGQPNIILKGGAVLYLPAGAVWKMTRAEDGEGAIVNFTLAGEGPAKAFGLTPTGFAKWQTLFTALEDAWLHERPGCAAKRLSLLYQAFSMLEEALARTELPAARQKALEKSIAYLEANLSKPAFSVESLAPVCDMCPTYFRQQFRRMYGTSPKQYLLNARIRRAKDLLASTDWTVTRIAEKAGFSSLYYFSKAFKAATKQSPREYRTGG
jgi:AraC-like DNA-binding protein